MPREVGLNEGDTLTVDIGEGRRKPIGDGDPLALVERALVIANLKSVAEQPAMLSNLMFANLVANVNLTQQNAASNQQAANEVGRAVTGKVVNTVLNLGPLEAMSALQLLTGNSFAESLIDLKAAVGRLKNKAS